MPVQGVHIDSEHRDVAALEIGDRWVALAQVGEAEEWCRGISKCRFHGREPGVDLLLRAFVGLSRQVPVGPSVPANRVPLGGNLLEAQGFGARHRGTAPSHHDRLRGPAGGLVVARTRLPGYRACHDLARLKRPDAARWRSISQWRRLGGVCGQGGTRLHHRGQDWPSQCAHGRGSCRDLPRPIGSCFTRVTGSATVSPWQSVTRADSGKDLELPPKTVFISASGISPIAESRDSLDLEFALHAGFVVAGNVAAEFEISGFRKSPDNLPDLTLLQQTLLP